MINEKKHIAIRSESGTWRVITTSFDRQPGDVVMVEKTKFVVMATGTLEQCRNVMKFNIIRNREHIKSGGTITMKSTGMKPRDEIILKSQP